MIDIDKYEGHQVSEFKTSVAGPKHSWVTHRHTAGAKDAMFVNHATAALVVDAPLLLEEVKRLRELMLKGSNDYTTSYTDLRDIIEEVHWALTGDDDEYTESSEARIKYALRILSEVIG